jgi:diketogulonate reductase-like aldo/keto reductase
MRALPLCYHRLAFKLNDGWEIPAVGLGTCHVKPDDARNAVQTALSTGYRHIDA